jgi:cellulose synthase (UDP-forming)
MLHFFYPLPRLVFLTSPLAFLLLGVNIISASPIAIVAYAGPHIVHTIATNSRLQRNWRHSFWNEVYETVLALTLIRPTTTALIDPTRGKFNVTAKGTIIEKDYFDVGAVRLNLILAALLVIGLLHGVYGIIVTPHTDLAFQAYLLNSIWVFFSLTTVFVAIAVGREREQPRRRPRLTVALPAILILPDGTEVPAVTQDISRGGVSLSVDQLIGVPPGTAMRIVLPVGGAKTSITARLLWVRPAGDGVVCGIGFKPANITEETAVIRSVFGRADAWVNWNHHDIDRPLASLWSILVSVVGVFQRPKPLPAAAVPPSDEGNVYEATKGTLPENDPLKNVTVVRPRKALALGIALCLLLPFATPYAAKAQTGGGTTANVLPTPTNPPLPSLPPIELRSPASASDNNASPAQPAVPSAVPSPVSTSGPPTSTRTVVFTLRQLGASGPLTLRGTSPIQGLLFGIRSDEVVSGALLTLNGAMSPSLIPALSNVTVTLNEQYVGTIPVDASQSQFGPVSMNINPSFFLPENRLNFRFAGAYSAGCNDPLSNLLWSTISDNSTLTLVLTKLPPAFDLSTLPAPFFDPHELQTLKLPFILPAQPSDEELKAAGIVASWFGAQAGFRGTGFTVSNDAPPNGDAIVVVVGNDAAQDLSLPQFQGPTLAEIPNPNDPVSSLLVIGGRNGDEVIAAAEALALGNRLAFGSAETVTAPDIPVRAAYDAPNWIPTDRKVQLGELVAAGALNGNGYSGVLNVPFQTSPDLYNWRQQPFKLNLLFRAPPGPILDLATSHLDVAINGTYLASTSLAPKLSPIGWLQHIFGLGGAGNGEGRFAVVIPPYDMFAQNQLQMTFDTRPLNRGACQAIPGDIRFAIDPASTIDLSDTYHFSPQPRLSYFRNAGFPFSIYADLSGTAVVLPQQPDILELGAYLNLMGRFGRLTGYPATRVAVVRPNEVSTVSDRHLLVLANMAQANDISALLIDTPVQLDGTNLRVPLPGALDEIGQVFGDPIAANHRRSAALLQAQLGGNDAVLMGAQSPLTSGRTEIVLLAASSQGLGNLVQALDDPNQQTLIHGDLAVLAGGTVSSYRIGPQYWIGWIPPWLWPTWFLRGRPDLMLLLLIGACLLTAVGIYWPLRRRSARRLSVRDQK